MILFLACAVLCALILAWTFRPLRTPRAFYALSVLCALSTLGLYLLMGKPDLPASPYDAEVAEQTVFAQENKAAFLARLEKDPNDADALIRLAAVEMLQGRDGSALLARAEKITPKDPRIGTLRLMK